MERERRRSSTGASSAADGGSDPPDIFAAALQGDLAQVRALIARRDDRMEAGGYTALGLAVSAGHTEIARLLLREGVTVDAADAEGVTALMHAAMHGYGSLVDLLLLHGASPLTTRADGESAHTLAALYGRPAALGAFFRHDATLVEARNGLGRTPLHNAVTLRHLITIKYLLGAWRADVNATDAQGNTPLHLCRGPLEALTLLFHGTATRPSLTARNAAGRTPLEEISFSSPSNVVIQALQDAEGRDDAAEWLAGPGIDAKLLSFLTDSPVRSPPKTCPDPPWWSQLTPAVVLGSLAPYVLGLTLAFSVTAGAAMLFLTPVAAAWWGMCLAHAGCRRHLQSLLSPCPGLSFLLGVTERPEALRHALDIRAPLGLVLAILFLMATQAVLVTPQLIRQRPLLCLASYTFQALLIYAYTRAVLTRPSLIPGGGADAAAGYWAALEALPPNAGFPSDFCERSELRKEPRARYSPMAGGMIEVRQAAPHPCVPPLSLSLFKPLFLSLKPLSAPRFTPPPCPVLSCSLSPAPPHSMAGEMIEVRRE
jgi:ankyrin repeat protein